MRWFAMAIVVVLAGLTFANSDRIAAYVADECYVDIGGTSIHVAGVTSECALQTSNDGNHLVFQSTDYVYVTVCGAQTRPNWGYTVVAFSGRDGTQQLSNTWEEMCALDESTQLPDGLSPDYPETLARYVWSHDTQNSRITQEELARLKADFESAETIVVTATQLQTLLGQQQAN